MGVKLGLSLREGYRLMVSENRVMRRIFGPNTEEVTGGWKKLYDEELIICSIYLILLELSYQG
jgi:hypothetical protein